MDESQIPLNRKFIGKEYIEDRNFDIEFHWIPIKDVKKFEIYPTNAKDLLDKINDGIKHFVYIEGDKYSE